MWQKIVVGVLVVTVLGAVAVAIIDAQGAATAADVGAVILPTPTPAPMAQQALAGNGNGGGNGAQQHSQGQATGAGAAAPQQQNQSIDNVGEAWSGEATIVEIGDVGMTVTLADGSQVFVELGPTTYWQGQGTLTPGEVVQITGFFNGDQYHAATITKLDGATLALRSESGQPLWSGGAAGGHSASGAAAGGQGAGGAGEVQVAPEDWVTVAGQVVAVNRNGLTVQSDSGAMLTLTFGNARFWQGQAVTFAAGDEVTIQGFWQDGQFQTGQVAKDATGERLLLRDPNGRPLWGGPGRQGGSTAMQSNG